MRRSLSIRLVAMNHEFRIGATAELMQIHADAFAVRIHAEWYKPVQQQQDKEQQRQENAKQSGNAHKLCQHLSMLRRKDSRSRKSPQARDQVSGNGSGRIID